MQYHCLQVQITCWNIQGLSSVLYSFSSSKWHSEKEYAPNTYLIQTQLFSNRCFLKLWKIHVKTYLLELLFNNVAGFKTWNFIKKTQVQAQVLSCKFSTILQKALFTKHLQMAAPDDFFVSTKSLIHWSHFVHFFLHFFLVLLIIAIMGVYLENT